MKIASMVLAGVLLAGSVQAQQINACYNKKTGALRISDQCKKVEAPISWGGQGEKGVQGEPGYSGPSVLDSTGAIIGIVATPSPSIFIPSLGAFIAIGSNGEVRSHDSLMFESIDCSGVGYMGYNPDPLWNFKGISEYLGKYYIRTDEVMTKTIGSSDYGYDENNNTVHQCSRPCGYHYYMLIPNPPPLDDTWKDYYAIQFIPATTDCKKWYGGDPRNHWTVLDEKVQTAQEVTLPFSLPLALPLSFR